MIKAFFLIAARHLVERPVRTTLVVLGVAVGVSASMAIRLANVEVLRTFERSVTTVVGTTTIQVVGHERGFDERLIRRVRQYPHVLMANPILHQAVTVRGGPHHGRSLLIGGVDLLDAAKATNSLMLLDVPEERSVQSLLARDAIFIGKKAALKWDLQVGDVLHIMVGTDEHQVVVHGLVESSRSEGERGDHVAIMDIAAAQALFERVGQLDRIDVVTESGRSVEKIMEELKRFLPSTVIVERPSQRNRQVERMIRAFQLNLATLSTVGLLVGIFLVYNTVAFAVVQHRREIGIFRALGMSRRQVGTLFLSEAALIGLCGGLLGAGLGMGLAYFLVSLVSESVSELYAPVSVETIRIQPHLLAEGGAIGLVVSILGAMSPCWEASRTSAAQILAPGSHEITNEIHVSRFVWIGCGAFVLAGVLAIPGPMNGVPVFGYASAFFLLLGCTFFGPVSVQSLRWIARVRWRNRVGLLYGLAADQVTRASGRASVTLAALMVGIAIMVGVGIMVQSFRHTVELWVDQTMLADFLVVPVSWLHGTEQDMPANQLPFALVDQVASIPGVAAVDPYREKQIDVQGRIVSLVTRDFALHAERSQYLFVQGNSREILQQAIAQKGVIISEVLAKTLNIGSRDRITLSTSIGRQGFPIVGVFYDYATDGGKVVMDRSLYDQLWNDSETSVFAVYLESGVDLEHVRETIDETLKQDNQVTIVSNRELRTEILTIFDRTFRVTYVLELIALSVALLGIVNTLVTAIIERQREIATLRAIGVSAPQIQGIVFWESAYLGLLGAFLGVLGGLLLSVLLIEVINKQSFGWTVQFMVPGKILLEAIGVGLTAAMLAGYFPARWAAKQSIVEGLRYE